MVPVAAAALPVAATAALALAPASASAVTSVTAARAGQVAAAPRPGGLLKGHESAQLTLDSVGAGVTVRIQGGGAGTSNCTNDETSKTVTTGSGPVQETISFDAKSSGSCAFEKSFSYFTVSVTGKNTSGIPYDSTTRVLFGQQAARQPYISTCEAGHDRRMSCRETSPRSLELRAFPTEVRAPGSPALTSTRSTIMNLSGVGAGPRVSIQGGGAGTSNCTNDETTTSFTAAGGLIVQVLGFDAKSSGSCAFESSYSQFRISVKGRAADGASFDSSANVEYGGSATLGYRASCGDPKYLHHMRCAVSGNQLYLNADPVAGW
ncbi:MAG: hypothetical protein JO016_16735 [Actinobacteria bacterium]|nr:hypothetical protein [Actinomycetota bacterium]